VKDFIAKMSRRTQSYTNSEILLAQPLQPIRLYLFGRSDKNKKIFEDLAFLILSSCKITGYSSSGSTVESRDLITISPRSSGSEHWARRPCARFESCGVHIPHLGGNHRTIKHYCMLFYSDFSRH